MYVSSQKPRAKTLYQSFRRQRNGDCFPFRGPSLVHILAHPALVPGASHSKQPPFLRRLVHGLVEKLPMYECQGMELTCCERGEFIRESLRP